MANAPDFYCDHLHKQFGIYHVTWLPDMELKVGDIIKLDDGEIIPYSSLAAMQIPFEAAPDETTTDYDCNFGSGISIKPVAQASTPDVGNVINDVKAGFDIRFTNDKSIVFKLTGCRSYMIKEIAPIEQAVIKKYKEHSWQKEWLIITEVKKADSGTIIIALACNTGVSLTTQVDINAGPVKLTDASLKADNNITSNNVLHFTKNGITPLYKCMGIKTPLFGNNSLGSRGIGAPEAIDNLRLAEITPDDTEDQTLVINDADI